MYRVCIVTISGIMAANAILIQIRVSKVSKDSKDFKDGSLPPTSTNNVLIKTKIKKTITHSQSSAINI